MESSFLQAIIARRTDLGLLYFVNEFSYNLFKDLPEHVQSSIAIHFIVRKYKGCEAAYRLSLFGLINNCDDEWINATFEEPYVREFVRREKNENFFSQVWQRDRVVSTTDRLHFKTLGLLRYASPEWCKFRFRGKELLKALHQSGSLTAELGIDWYANAFKDNRWYLKKALKATGLLTADGGLDFYIKEGLSKTAIELGLAKDKPIEWFLDNFKDPYDLLDALKAEKRFPKDVDLEWYVQHFSDDHVIEPPYLFEALKESGLLKTADPDWCVKHFNDDHLIEALEESGAFDSGVLTRDWYKDNIKESSWRSTNLYDVLKRTKLLTKDVGMKWYLEAFKCDGSAILAIHEAGLFDSKCDFGWCCLRFNSDRCRLQAAKLAGALTSVNRNVLAKYLSGKYLYEALDIAGLFTDMADELKDSFPPLGSDKVNYARDWYSKHFKGEMLLDALKKSGLLTSCPGRDWYKDKLGGSLLYEALELAGLLTSEPGYDWYRIAFKKTQYERGNRSLLVKALRETGLLTKSPGRDWYATSLKRYYDDLLEVLKETGFLTAEPGRDWYAFHFHGKNLYDILKDTGLLTRDAGHDWYASHFYGRSLYEALKATDLFQHDSHLSICGRRSHCYYSDRTRKYANMALYRAGLLDDDGSHRWFASHLEGEELYLALKNNGLLGKPIKQEKSWKLPDFKWYAYRFEGELLLRCLDEAGLLPSIPSPYLRYFKGDLYDRAKKMKWEHWKYRDYPEHIRGGPIAPGHENYDTWSIHDTDSRNSVSDCSFFDGSRESDSLF